MGYYQQIENEKKKALYGAGGTKDNPTGDSYYAVMKAKQAVNVDQTKVNLNYLGNNKWSGDSQVKYSTIEDHPANESEIFSKKGTKEKEKLYLVAYKKGDSKKVRNRLVHDIEYGVTRKKPNWENSTNGIYMELDVTDKNNNQSRWNEIVRKHIKTRNGNLPWNHWANDVQYKRGTRSQVILRKTTPQSINSLVMSGSKLGSRGHVFYPSIHDLDNGKDRTLWAQSSVHGIDQGGFIGKSSRSALAGEVYMQNIRADVDNKYAPEENEIIDKLSDTNREANKKNEAKNKAYERIKLIASQTQGSDYLTRRNSILDSKGNNPSDPNGQTIEQILKGGGFDDDEIKNITMGLKDSYKNFYKTDKISNKWTGASAVGDGNSLYDFKMNEFDSKYYGSKETTGQVTTALWDAAKNDTFLGSKDENIDITEGFGNKDTFL